MASGSPNPEGSNGKVDANELIAKFEDNQTGSKSKDKNELPDGIKKTLDADDELTTADINDRKEEDNSKLCTKALCCQTLAKFQAVATKLKKSPNSKAKFIELCQEKQCNKPHNVKQDVPTRWNSTYKQILSII
ncbi:hypothetical protein PCASD_02577 [Puccinia coronata f. sp. avenae]|uniref:Uncharacterized protein n=1 Tax=Puccinia coronata f. sp. avenae TaxID=200324 RepID=A0A2N5VBI4_9BASI|nr:hypothetical protein PCASD_08747 [Puccinia coronata f. sp. avenae]PLW47367.1 hypothetical protein PCASD_02577 [Puccinia coronata f. sp. avenae]